MKYNCVRLRKLFTKHLPQADVPVCIYHSSECKCSMCILVLQRSINKSAFYPVYEPGDRNGYLQVMYYFTYLIDGNSHIVGRHQGSGGVKSIPIKLHGLKTAGDRGIELSRQNGRNESLRGTGRGL